MDKEAFGKGRIRQSPDRHHGGVMAGASSIHDSRGSTGSGTLSSTIVMG